MLVFKHDFTWNLILNFVFYVKLKLLKTMGKGDKKTKRGKINRGTFGARRPRIKKRRSIESKISISNKATPK
jgi:30S ribosomal protein S31